MLIRASLGVVRRFKVWRRALQKPAMPAGSGTSEVLEAGRGGTKGWLIPVCGKPEREGTAFHAPQTITAESSRQGQICSPITR